MIKNDEVITTESGITTLVSEVQLVNVSPLTSVNRGGNTIDFTFMIYPF